MATGIRTINIYYYEEVLNKVVGGKFMKPHELVWEIIDTYVRSKDDHECRYALRLLDKDTVTNRKIAVKQKGGL